MKKTYVTKMPDHIGAFLKASKCFSELGINITRVSYNKAVDSHTLFIEVDGEESLFEMANAKLCSKERAAFTQRLGVGEWSIFGGHGQKKVYSLLAK